VWFTGAYNALFVKVAAVSVSTRGAMRDSFWIVGNTEMIGKLKNRHVGNAAG